MKRALIFWGGWDGHHPEAVANLFAGELRKAGFETVIDPHLDRLADGDALRMFDLIVPCWTMGSLSPGQTVGLQAAVKAGTGLAGAHGGMGDAFRGNVDYEWMVGGKFAGHPYVGPYTVRLTDREHPVTEGLPSDFVYESEQYYLLVDPGIHVLAETDYSFEGRTVAMPVAWTKKWGAGRVFYSALGHNPDEFARFPTALDLTMRGMIWAARK